MFVVLWAHEDESRAWVSLPYALCNDDVNAFLHTCASSLKINKDVAKVVILLYLTKKNPVFLFPNA